MIHSIVRALLLVFAVSNINVAATEVGHSVQFSFELLEHLFHNTVTYHV